MRAVVLGRKLAEHERRISDIAEAKVAAFASPPSLSGVQLREESCLAKGECVAGEDRAELRGGDFVRFACPGCQVERDGAAEDCSERVSVKNSMDH